jgi:hypothetical protein
VNRVGEFVGIIFGGNIAGGGFLLHGKAGPGGCGAFTGNYRGVAESV